MIIDDFLSQSYADEIENILNSPNQEWYFNRNISQDDKTKNLNYGFSYCCLLYTSPSPRDATLSRMPSSA